MISPTSRAALPQLSDALFLTDSGIETDLIFNGGWELPEFAAFVLLDDPEGYVALRDYFVRHVAVADSFGCGLILEAPTWRASRDWGARLGYPPAQLAEVNERAISLLADIRRTHVGSPIVISGCIGPQSDAYEPSSRMTADEAQAYHRDQIESLAATEADVVHAMTITHADEAIGIARAAIAVDMPVVISFTTETDGRLPHGTSLAEAIQAVDRATDFGPVYYGINCSHPTHFGPVFPADDEGGRRIRSLRANASSKSHAELDETETLDAGDPAELARLYRELRDDHPQLTILGGCCGTDATHVEAIGRACLPS
ncbi:MAG TPA: homocysteine S-methyltransferase family protein [Acidothermaceae bacterium]|jgi:S-methylmethionine-dependent homocysteine/selenocysteine methylase